MCLEMKTEKEKDWQNRWEEERQSLTVRQALKAHFVSCADACKRADWIWGLFFVFCFFFTMLFSFAWALTTFIDTSSTWISNCSLIESSSLSAQLNPVWHVFLSVCLYECVYGCESLKILQNTGTNNDLLRMFSFEPQLQKLSFLFCLISSAHFDLFCVLNYCVTLGKMIKPTCA